MSRFGGVRLFSKFGGPFADAFCLTVVGSGHVEGVWQTSHPSQGPCDHNRRQLGRVDYITLQRMTTPAQ